MAPCNYRHRKQVIQEKIGNPKDVPAAKWISWGLGGKVLGKGFGASCRQAQPWVRSLIARFDDRSQKKELRRQNHPCTDVPSTQEARAGRCRQPRGQKLLRGDKKKPWGLSPGSPWGYNILPNLSQDPSPAPTRPLPCSEGSQIQAETTRDFWRWQTATTPLHHRRINSTPELERASI